MELLTVQQTAQLLKVSPITIRRFIAAGRLPAMKIGRGVRVEREAVDRLLEPVASGRAAGKATKRRRRERQGRLFTMDDPLWRIVGMAHSEGPGDVSENKHKYLAEALLAKFTSEQE